MPPLRSPNDAATSWWWHAAADVDSLTLLAIAAACLAGLLLLGRAHLRLHRHHRPPHRSADAGTATLEFALVFPTLLFLGLVLLQTTLVMVGNFFVHYAAFAATRSAITYVPAPSMQPYAEPINVIVPAAGSPKYDAIWRAAVFAVMPVCGRDRAGASIDPALNPDAVVDGLRRWFEALGQTPPGWLETQVVGRLGYAARHTEITVLETFATDEGVAFEPLPGSSAHTFGPRDPISVRVEHRLNLSIPYARGLFADGQHDTDAGPGAYTDLTARYTLTNEGIDPALPDPPRLPRRP